MPDFLIHIAGLQPFRLSKACSELSIGRTPDQDIILEDAAISRTHARLSWQAGAVYFEDLGSRHGSFINGERARAPMRISPSDAIRLGPIDLKVAEIPLESHSLASPPGEEETQSLPVEDVQGWRRQGDRTDGLANGRETLDLFYEFSLMLLRDRATEQLMEDMLARLFVFLDAGQGAILLPDQAGELTLLATRSKGAPGTSTSRLSPGTIQATVERREALLLKELVPLQEAPGIGPAPGIATASAMAVPLEHGGEVLGLFYFDTGRTRPPFTEDDLRIVASLGNLAAARIVQQRLAEELRRKQDVERDFKVIEAADQAKGEFLAHMSHEMRTPMNAILGFLHLAQGEELPPNAADYLQKIEQSGRSLMELLDDVLDLAKIEARKLELESRPFRIEEILLGVTDLLGQTARNKDLTLSMTQGEGTRHRVLGDGMRLRQVLLNLVGNALKFTERGGIQVEVEQVEAIEGTALFQFSVKDTGIGMSSAQIEKLFSPFTQAEPDTTRRFGGTGLGLTISRRLVELMGGHIGVESHPGAGSRFLFTARFPQAADQSLLLETTPSAPQRNWGSALAGLRVLVVEDNAISRELTAILFKRVGVHVDLATNGIEALALAGGNDFDAIVMDLEMPEMDGFETTRRIRSGRRNQQAPILALTAHALASHRARCLAVGMNECLTKPIAPDVLYEALHRWTGKAGRVPALSPPVAETGTGVSHPLDLRCVAAIVNLPLALGRLDGREDLLVKFLKAFADDPVDAGSIRSAMATGNRAQAAAQAHGLKGIADTLAITGVAEAARELERQLQEPPAEGWEKVCDQLETALNKFRNAIRTQD